MALTSATLDIAQPTFAKTLATAKTLAKTLTTARITPAQLGAAITEINSPADVFSWAHSARALSARAPSTSSAYSAHALPAHALPATFTTFTTFTADPGEHCRQPD